MTDSRMSHSEGIAVRLFDKNRVVLDKEIGSGTFGKVYLASISDSRLSPVAIKVFRKELKGEVSQKEKDNAYEELLKLAVIDHENIVKLYGMVQDDMPWLVFEFMKDGNLLEYVLKNDNIKEKVLVRFCRDICNGMVFLHKNQVLHKDLAARNVLLSGKSAKIADLGLSSFLTEDEGDIYALNGKLFPFRHAAKECVVEQVYSYKSDVWSFGILMYEIFTGGLTPYGKDNKQPEVRRFIVEGITPLHLLEPHCSPKILSIMKSILTPRRQNRPTFEQLLAIFQKLLTGKSTVEQSTSENQQRTKGSSGFETFHKIKANGLSTSVNNLQNSNDHINKLTNSEIPHRIQAKLAKPNERFLTVSSTNLRSSSTPNLIDAVTLSVAEGSHFQQGMPSKPSERMNRDRNFLSVRSPTPGRRHSAQLEQIPLSSSPPSAAFDDDFEPRRRAYSNSRNDQLLKGFVQNRFTKKS